MFVTGIMRCSLVCDAAARLPRTALEPRRTRNLPKAKGAHAMRRRSFDRHPNADVTCKHLRIGLEQNPVGVEGDLADATSCSVGASHSNRKRGSCPDPRDGTISYRSSLVNGVTRCMLAATALSAALCWVTGDTVSSQPRSAGHAVAWRPRRIIACGWSAATMAYSEGLTTESTQRGSSGL